MRYLLAALLIFSFPAFAAEISEKYAESGNKGEIFWEQINNDDSTSEAKINLKGDRKCALYKFLIDGTTATVDLKLQAGRTAGSLKDLDTDQMPDGVRFSSVSTGNAGMVYLTDGEFVDISFSSAGSATQDLDIYLIPAGDCQ